MTDHQANFCHSVSAAFLKRWTEDEPGEIYGVAEYLLEENELSVDTPIDEAVEIVSAFISGPV